MLSDAINTTAPIIKYQIKPKKISEQNLSKDTIENIERLKNIRKKVKITGNVEDIQEMRNLRNTVKKFIDRKRQLNEHIKNGIKEKNLWNTINNNYKEQNESPSILHMNNKYATSPTDISNMLNDSYLDKITNL